MLLRSETRDSLGRTDKGRVILTQLMVKFLLRALAFNLNPRLALKQRTAYRMRMQ